MLYKWIILVSAILWFAGILALNIARDYRYWLTNRATNHNNRFWIRMWCLIPSAVGFTYFKAGNLVLEWYTLIYLALSSLMIALVWANLFSGIRNRLCGQKWLFPGSDGPEDGVIENLLQKHAWIQWVIILAGIASIWLYVTL